MQRLWESQATPLQSRGVAIPATPGNPEGGNNENTLTCPHLFVPRLTLVWDGFEMIKDTLITAERACVPFSERFEQSVSIARGALSS